VRAGKTGPPGLISKPTSAEATGQAPKTAPPPEKNPAAVALGKLGCVKGGKARAAALTPKKRAVGDPPHVTAVLPLQQSAALH